MHRFRQAAAFVILLAAIAPTLGADLQLPPGVDPPFIRSRTGEDLDRARTPLDKILSQLERPAYLPKPGEKPLDAAGAVEQRIAELKRTLAKDPKDTDAGRELIQLLVVMKDDPAAALPFRDLADPRTRSHLPLAAKPVDQLGENELMDLGLWYQDLSASVKGAARKTVLSRAAGCFERFLALHKKEDLLRSTAAAAMKKVAAAQKSAATPGLAGTPLHVQRSYARARAAWREGQPHVAINLLEAANNIAPNQPEILRTLGLIYFTEVRNPVQGAQFLKQALALEPDDLDILFLLGRYEFLQLRQWKSAIVIFAHGTTVKSPDGDPAVPALLRLFLARALQSEGYDAAAAEQFEQFAGNPPRLARSTRYFNEVAAFARGLPVIWQQLGDAHLRLGNVDKALSAYLKAMAENPDDAAALVSRVVYAQLRANRADDALKTAVDLVRKTGGDKASLALLKYLAESGASARQLAVELRRTYEQLDRPAVVALALASLMGAEGTKFLTDHLTARPADREVFQHVLERSLPKQGPRDYPQAIALTASLVKALPVATERYGQLLLDIAGKMEELLAGFDALPQDQKDQPVVRLLRAMALLRANKDDAAIEEFGKAAAADKSLVVAQVGLVKLLIERQEFERAGKVLESLKSSEDPRVLELRLRVLRETDRIEEALKLVDTLLEKNRKDAGLLVEKAKLQIASNDVPDAQKTLEDAIEANPTAEALYEAFFDLLDQHESPTRVRDAARLTERAQRHIPASKIARVKQAEQLITRRDFPGAEQLLRAVQKEAPDDRRSLEMLSLLLTFTRREAEADELIEARLKAYPRDKEVLQVAVMHYRRSNNKDRLYEVLEQFINAALTGEDRDQELAALHIRNERPEKAIALLTEALTEKDRIKDPRTMVRMLGIALTRAKQLDKAEDFFKRIADAHSKHWGDVQFELAMLYERQNRKDASEKLLENVLVKEPAHPKANNALGYSWADQGKNLEKAEKMIAAALKEEPDNAAYLDSMGWVNYKLGKFDEAVKFLERSRLQEGGEHPVILDHLGDALYRAGRQIDALQAWLRAQGKIDPDELEEDPELKTVSAAVKAKIQAVQTAKEPKLAEVPNLPKEKDEERKEKDEKNEK